MSNAKKILFLSDIYAFNFNLLFKKMKHTKHILEVLQVYYQLFHLY